jgi:hypothetical protein
VPLKSPATSLELVNCIDVKFPAIAAEFKF